MNEQMLWAVGAAAVVLVAVIWWLAVKDRRQGGLPDGVTLRWTQHAKKRMGERDVTAEQVTTVLNRPHRQEKDPIENSVRLERDFGDHETLKVWVAEPWPPTREVIIKSTAWQYSSTVRIPIDKIGYLIGKNGRTVESIRNITGARVNVGDDGIVRISAGDSNSVRSAKDKVVAIVGRPLQQEGRQSAPE